ncbi:MAG: Gfo/Idh/MocA family oxidoreductase [Caldilineaceae bacterium]|nr:Gfo/Idh/MocA family oxidoreductase [Caldilineaceae bacterium]
MAPTRFALIGAGNIAKIYVQAFAAIPDAQVTVVCSRTQATGAALAASCGAIWLPDYREAVTRSDVDAVVVATPSGSHGEIAVAAARAGKHLLVEKPLEITLARADAIIEAAEQAGVVLACVFPLRFAAGVGHAKTAVDAGRLGRLTLADVYVKWYRPQSYYDRAWRGAWESDGGGALMNQAIHNIDLVRWLAGPVASVFGRTATLVHRMQTEDTACALLTFESGALGVIQGATSAWPGDPARVELHGDRGTIVLEEGRIAVWKLAAGTPQEEAAMLGLEPVSGSGASDPLAIGFEKHRRQIVDLIEAIRSGRAPAIQGAEARAAVEIVRAVYRSAQSGEVVKLPLTGDATLGG